MPEPSHTRDDLTRLLEQAARGDSSAADAAMSLVYGVLRDLAKARMRGLPHGQTLQPTALVHEAYLRIATRQPDGWDGRRHFFFMASRAMRDILVEQARRKGTQKRGADRARVDIEDLGLSIEPPGEDMLALDEVLHRLEQKDPDAYQIVTLRYYGGLSVAEVAELFGVTTRTIERRWRFLRAWLADEINK